MTMADTGGRMGSTVYPGSSTLQPGALPPMAWPWLGATGAVCRASDRSPALNRAP
jgi:hypothetical protein